MISKMDGAALAAMGVTVKVDQAGRAVLSMPDGKKIVITGDNAEALRKIAEVNADKEMSPDEKKQALGELNEALKSAEPVKYPGNIELVKKYYNDLDANAQ